MRTPHTSCRKGTTVFIILRSGERFEDKFVDRKGKHIVLENYGRLEVKNLRSFGIRKLKATST